MHWFKASKHWLPGTGPGGSLELRESKQPAHLRRILPSLHAKACPSNSCLSSLKALDGILPSYLSLPSAGITYVLVCTKVPSFATLSCKSLKTVSEQSPHTCCATGKACTILKNITFLQKVQRGVFVTTVRYTVISQFKNTFTWCYPFSNRASSGCVKEKGSPDTGQCPSASEWPCAS